jgi:hypothetical protein
MSESDLTGIMTFRKSGVQNKPLFVAKVNDEYILAAYKGAFSEYDILIKYRQKKGEKWSRIRTPKHIHWAVDILIKMNMEREKTKQFLDFLICVWEKTQPIKSEEQRTKVLDLNYLLESNKEDVVRYGKLSKKGEYSVKFLMLLAKLLMIQEKTNLETAYMFKNLLKALKEGEDIFKIVSIATHR